MIAVARQLVKNFAKEMGRSLCLPQPTGLKVIAKQFAQDFATQKGFYSWKPGDPLSNDMLIKQFLRYIKDKTRYSGMIEGIVVGSSDRHYIGQVISEVRSDPEFHNACMTGDTKTINHLLDEVINVEVARICDDSIETDPLYRRVRTGGKRKKLTTTRRKSRNGYN